DTYVGDIYWYNENGLDNGLRHYINKTTVKELTYYNPDGTIWQTITYNDEGKKKEINTYSGNEIAFSGYIDSAKKLLGTFPADYYATYHLRDYEKTENDTQLPTTLEAAPMMENENVGIASSQKPA